MEQETFLFILIKQFEETKVNYNKAREQAIKNLDNDIKSYCELSQHIDNVKRYSAELNLLQIIIDMYKYYIL